MMALNKKRSLACLRPVACRTATAGGFWSLTGKASASLRRHRASIDRHMSVKAAPFYSTVHNGAPTVTPERPVEVAG